jgi:hypothetical protein
MSTGPKRLAGARTLLARPDVIHIGLQSGNSDSKGWLAAIFKLRDKCGRWGTSMRYLVIAAICLLLTACGTKYQDMGFTGGVAAGQVTADTWRIQARGNAYTGASTVQDFVLLKAAETTQAAGGTHFVLISSSDATRSGVIVTPGQSTTTFSGNQAFTTTTPGSATQFIKPGQDTYIRVLKGPQNGALSAAEIIQFTGARVKRG